MVTLDEYLKLLANAQRRQLLRALLDDSGGAVTVERDDRQAYARLHHFHLPKLEAAGLIDWDQRDGTVVRGPAFDDIVPLLEALDEVTGESGTDGEHGPDTTNETENGATGTK